MTPDQAIEFMKKHKILHFRTPEGLELTLDPEALLIPDPKALEEEVGPEMDVVGPTGMTRQQQMDLLGQVFEADFQPSPARPASKKRA